MSEPWLIVIWILERLRDRYIDFPLNFNERAEHDD